MTLGYKKTTKILAPEELKKVKISTEKLAGELQGKENEKHQIAAEITIPYDREQVWQVLTDYEALPDFLPHLVKSQRLPHPESGIRVEQIGSKCPLHFCFSARVVLDLIEDFPQKIQFQMIEGDFKHFSGVWELSEAAEKICLLRYALEIIPKIPMPIPLLKQQLSQDLPVNLLAISQRVSAIFD